MEIVIRIGRKVQVIVSSKYVVFFFRPHNLVKLLVVFSLLSHLSIVIKYWITAHGCLTSGAMLKWYCNFRCVSSHMDCDFACRFFGPERNWSASMHIKFHSWNMSIIWLCAVEVVLHLLLFFFLISRLFPHVAEISLFIFLVNISIANGIESKWNWVNVTQITCSIDKIDNWNVRIVKTRCGGGAE